MPPVFRLLLNTSRLLGPVMFVVCALGLAAPTVSAAVHRLKAKDTLAVAEIDAGDLLEFTLADGSVRKFELISTDARVLYTNLARPRKAQPGGGTIYEMSCVLKADGQLVELRRYVCSQESFYEPYVINGVRLWFDAVADVEKFLTYDHGDCRPGRQARFALQDAARRIAPEEILPWYDNPAGFIDIADVHNGDDCWMGAFAGADAHNGLDINQRAGSRNYAPIAFDDHYLFESLAAGNDNNRWRGVRRWASGDEWILQTHHILSLLHPEHSQIEAGAAFATAAGVKIGGREHSHYVFKVRPAGAAGEVMIDPWILFWQAFEDRKQRQGVIKAAMTPLAPVRVGDPVAFSSAASRPGPGRSLVRVRWTFGDGGASHDREASHVFARPGVYPVTLTVDDGAHLASTTQHITVTGPELARPVLSLMAPDEPAFRPRPRDAMDVYGVAPKFFPHEISLVARAESPRPRVREFRLGNRGGGTLPPATATIAYSSGRDWLRFEISGKGDEQQGLLHADATGLPPALYRARVTVTAPGAVNSPQSFDVSLLVPSHPALPPRSRRVQFPREKTVEEDAPSEVYATPWFWFAHRFPGHPQGGGGSHLMNGGRARDGEFVRFTPDLRKARYELRLPTAAPYEEGCRFEVRVRHAGGLSSVWMEPAKSRVIGAFDFEDGTDGYVEIHAGGSTGQVLADAVIFKRLGP
jgi:FOG: PKD repeat